MSIKLKGSTDGSVTLQAPTDTSPTGTDKTFTLPTADGSAGQALTTNGGGALSWGSYLPLAGGTLTGAVVGPNYSQLANWQFVGNDLTSRYNNTGTFRRSLIVSSDNSLIINFNNDHGKVFMGGGLQIDGSFSASICNYGYLANSATAGYFSGCQTVNTGLSVPNGRIHTTEINTTSDRRYKEDIEPIAESVALAFVQNVEPVSFRWKEEHPNHSEGQRIGYIAQDVAAAGFHNLVGFSPASEEACAEYDAVDPVTNVDNPQDAFFSLNYDDAAVLTHRALQVALAKIESQGAAIAALETRLAALEVTP